METTKKDLSISMLKTNIVLIPWMAVVYGLMVGIYYLIYGTVSSEGFIKSTSFWISLIVGIIIHEAIHGFTWMKAGRIPFDQIKYGVQWKTLTPYAHSKIPMRKDVYVLGAVLPGILLGVIPYIVGLIIGHPWVIYFGAIFTVAAAGDALIIWLIRDVKPDELVEDHPTRAGCYVLPTAPLSGAPSI